MPLRGRRGRKLRLGRPYLEPCPGKPPEESRQLRNDARVDDPTGGCQPPDALPLSYTVYVKADKSVGESIVPGTENRHAHAHATAVIEPLCTFKLPAEDAGDDVLPRLSCKDRDWDLDPDDLTDLPGPEDLFDVHLAD